MNRWRLFHRRGEIKIVFVAAEFRDRLQLPNLKYFDETVFLELRQILFDRRHIEVNFFGKHGEV